MSKRIEKIRRKKIEKIGQDLAAGLQEGLKHTTEGIEKAVREAMEAGIPPEVVARIAGQIFGFAVAEDLQIKEDHETGEEKNIQRSSM